MVTINKIDRADVRVEQQVETPVQAPVIPELAPVAIGPAYQIVSALDENSSPQSSAQVGTYSNKILEIKTYSFPDPRNNNAYLDFLDDETRLFLQIGNEVRELKDDERWLAGNYTTAATSVRAIGTGTKSPVISIVGGVPAPTFTQAATQAVLTGTGDVSAPVALDGLVLKLCIDWKEWVTITFVGSIAQADIVTQINAAWAAAGNTGTIASASGNFIALTSLAFGEEGAVKVDDAASTAKTILGFTGANQIAFGRPYPPQPGDEFYADGNLLGTIVSVDSDTQLTLDTEQIVYTGSTPGELNATRWYIRALNLTTPKASNRPTAELYKQPTATTATLLGTVDILTGGANVNALTFIFKLDEETTWTTVTFSGVDPISAADIVTAINMKYGKVIASLSGNFLLITSPTNGNTSRIEIGPGTANAALGFVNATKREGVSVGDLQMSGAYLRDKLTSAILDPGLGIAYLQYRALRKDVTPLGADPKLITGSSEDLTSLEADIGPFTTQNPLGLAMLAMTRAAPGTTVNGFGVDSVSDDAEGDRSAYARTFSWLEAQDVYAIAPLTENEEVHEDLHNHCITQSSKENSRFRVCYFSRATPDRKATTLASSGTDANSISSGVFETESDLSAALLNAGITNPAALTVADGVYVMFSGDNNRYNLASVSGMQGTGNTTFAVGDNTDGFYATSAIPSTIIAKAWSLYIRGALIATVGGLTDWQTISEAHQIKSTGFANRRTRSTVPDRTIFTDGEDQTVDTKGYYLSAATAAHCCHLGPAQGKTNYAIDGFNQLYNSNDKYNEGQLKIVGYNNYLFVQEPIGPGNAITRWHQATTDPTNDDTREESITTQLDWGSLVLRRGLKSFIGQVNINADNFDDLFSTALEGLFSFIIGNSAWKGAELIELKKSETSKTKLEIKIRPTLFYPLNNADITLTI